MKVFLKYIFFIITLNLFGFFVFAEENPILTSYRRNFVRADINTKADIVNDSLKITDIDMSPFFMDVLDYVENSYKLLENDEVLLSMGINAVNSLNKNNYNNALYKIIFLFSQIKNELFQISCLNAFKKFGVVDAKLIELLNDKYYSLFLKNQEENRASNNLLKTYVSTLGVIGNSASFSILFNSLTQTKDLLLKIAIKNALNLISCNFFSEIVAIIEKKDIYSIQIAFEVAREKKDLSTVQLGQITEMVLTSGFNNLKNNPKLSRDLIVNCLEVVTDLKWTGVYNLVISYFYLVQSEYNAGNIDVKDLIVVVKCMGFMSSKESVDSLAIFLGVLNSQVERGNPYDEALLITVIEALGELGDKTAFDYLLYVDYLDYSEAVKLKARDAILRLKW